MSAACIPAYDPDPAAAVVLVAETRSEMEIR
jgi:hypothetical protein